MKTTNNKFIFHLLAAACMVIALFCPAATNAQSNLNFNLKVDFVPNSIFNYTCDTAKIYLTLHDTVNISKIHVTITRYDNQQQILQHAFLFDSNTGLPSGCSYHRKGYTVTLIAGHFPLHIYDMAFALEDNNHNIGTPVLFYR